MNAKSLYKTFSSHLRRALNAGAKGYLSMEGFRGTNEQKAARFAAISKILATGRCPAPTINRELWSETFYKINKPKYIQIWVNGRHGVESITIKHNRQQVNAK